MRRRQLSGRVSLSHKDSVPEVLGETSAGGEARRQSRRGARCKEASRTIDVKVWGTGNNWVAATRTAGTLRFPPAPCPDTSMNWPGARERAAGCFRRLRDFRSSSWRCAYSFSSCWFSVEASCVCSCFSCRPPRIVIVHDPRVDCLSSSEVRRRSPDLRRHLFGCTALKLRTPPRAGLQATESAPEPELRRAISGALLARRVRGQFSRASYWATYVLKKRSPALRADQCDASLLENIEPAAYPPPFAPTQKPWPLPAPGGGAPT